MRTVFGVFGDPIAHSRSPHMHNAAFRELGMECTYHAFRVSRGNLKDALLGGKAMGFGGVNLTVPLKQEALKIVDADPLAKSIGAVNTIDFKDGMKGYNTDGFGAKRTLEEKSVEIKGSNLLIVGAGGASRAIAFQLAKDGANITIANRTEQKAIDLASDISFIATSARGCGLENIKELIMESDILINCTTMGMHPNTEGTIATSEEMHPELTVLDIVYNPLETRLLKEAKKAGAKAITGEMMLIYQGAEAFRIWTGVEPPVSTMKKAVLEEL
ncbi:shikimate dehydrogenase [Methanolobus halotolerans]|uniref:Shikimate dehydrogenase (NADP(+)) n=1 Tax=Methanolobus halotolerans TaxID=2052935 RepID=A0A4E0R0F4_9EURY|nr:shikimate dehydrogenase [Methanolobus halotolerans]TGC09796.1 shikimate dehydrogenase [Methanolobus halotolerans]